VEKKSSVSTEGTVCSIENKVTVCL